MKKILSVFLSISVLIASCAFVAFAEGFPDGIADGSQESLEKAWSNYFEGLPGDVNEDGEFTIEDARSALLYSAGLAQTINEAKADLDGDGMVTAIDARMLLRVSISLDPQSNLTDAQLVNLFNALLNGIKPNALSYKVGSASETKDVTYDNTAAVESFNKQINALMESTSETGSMDFGAELTASKGTAAYTANVSGVASTSGYPVKGEDYASCLTLDDISSIAYLENQSYTYDRRSGSIRRSSSTGTLINSVRSLGEIELTDLDALTVSFGSESLTADTLSSSDFSVSKCFDLPDYSELLAGYDEINHMFDAELIEMIEKINGTMDIQANFNYLTFHDSSVTIYFDHETKKICAVSYDLNYDFSVGIFMNIDFPALFDLLGLKLTIDHQTINIVDQEHLNNFYFFETNYTSLNR